MDLYLCDALFYLNGRDPSVKRLLCVLVFAAKLHSQCVMCQRTAAAQQWERAQVLNTGIFVLLLPPLLILAAIVYIAYKRSEN